MIRAQSWTELEAVAWERERQDAAREAGRLRVDCTDPAVADAEKYLVLAEEVGEVAKAIHEGEGDVALLVELRQVAAVAVAMAEGVAARLEDAAEPAGWTAVEGGVSTTEPF